MNGLEKIHKGVQTLEELSEKIQKSLLEKRSLCRCLDYIKAYSGTDYLRHVKFSSSNYQRVYLEEYSTELFDVFLICWEEGQVAPPHDHPDEGCVLRILEGQVTENLYGQSNGPECGFCKIKSRELMAGDVSYLEKSQYIHSVHAHKGRCISIHFYPPNYCPKYYEINKNNSF